MIAPNVCTPDNDKLITILRMAAKELKLMARYWTPPSEGHRRKNEKNLKTINRALDQAISGLLKVTSP